jgi:predicted DNA binding CopG/RHH family protein
MRMKKKIPTFKSDRTAAAFVDKADLTQYDLSGARLTRFEIKPKDKSINLRLSGELYHAVRKRAARVGVPYQRFIRLALEQAIGGTK